MDPLAIYRCQKPDAEGYVALANPGVRLHYQLYRPTQQGTDSSSSSSSASPPSPPSPLLMVMGAFATKLHFSELARHVADASGHEVCIYDHMGVGKSSSPQLGPQTAAQLAADAVVVADTLWGAGTPIHVYGASMGGMVAQELALLLLPQHRLLSLALSITCRGMKPMYGLLSPIFAPKVLKNFFELWFWDSKPNLVRRLMRLLLTRQLLQLVHPCGRTYGEVYYEAWLEHFDELWTFNNHAAGACHAHVVLHHYLSDSQLATIRDSGVPIVCQVSTHDSLIPAAMQFELADQLRARTLTIPTGHMGFLPWRDRYYSMLLDQLAMGEAVKGVKAAQRERTAKAAAASAASAAAAGQRAVAAAAPGSLMASLAKPLLAALSSSTAVFSLSRAAAPAAAVGAAPVSISPASSPSKAEQQCAPDDAPDAAAVSDMWIVLGDGDSTAAALPSKVAADCCQDDATDVAAALDAARVC